MLVFEKLVNILLKTVNKYNNMKELELVIDEVTIV